jgi:phosphoenolpyruvate phosphomutase
MHDVVVVTGYMSEMIRATFGDEVRYCKYPSFTSTNNLYTLHHCRELLDEDIVILFSDVLISRESLVSCVENPYDLAILVDTSRVLEGTMRIKLKDGMVIDLGGHIPPSAGDGNFIGIAKFSAQGAALLRRELEDMVLEGRYQGSYYTATLPRLAAAGHAVHSVPLNGAPWIEIDEPSQYDAARDMDFYLC